MVRPGRDRLPGRVEVDETYLGRPERGVRGRQTGQKILIVVAAQEHGRGVGWIRMRNIQDGSANRLMPFERGCGAKPYTWLAERKDFPKAYHVLLQKVFC